MNKEQRTINNKWHSWFSVFCFLFFVFCLILPSLVFSQKLPENFEDLKGIGEGLWDRFIQGLKRAWEEAVEIWKKVIGWIGNIWNSYIFPFLKFIWQKIWNFFIRILEIIWEKIVKIVFDKINSMFK